MRRFFNTQAEQYRFNSPTSHFSDTLLEGDVLSYGWLRQMAELNFGSLAGSERDRMVFDLVCDLIEAGVAVVGDAQNDGKMLLIHPWPERSAPLRERLERAVAEASPGDQDWAFWLQLTEHYGRK
jgi:hypothetical protein